MSLRYLHFEHAEDSDGAGTLEAGMQVMSGSFTRQYAAQKGSTVCATFSPFGEVCARFE